MGWEEEVDLSFQELEMILNRFQLDLIGGAVQVPPLPHPHGILRRAAIKRNAMDVSGRRRRRRMGREREK